jgi:hypothetical protein
MKAIPYQIEDLEDAEDLAEDLLGTQALVFRGTAWRLEGTVGREAMRLIEDGLLMLPKVAHKDYYGSTVPARDWLVPGTKGTYQYVARLSGEGWARRLARAEREVT